MNNTTQSSLQDEDIKTIGKLFIPLRVFGKLKKKSLSFFNAVFSYIHLISVLSSN